MVRRTRIAVAVVAMAIALSACGKDRVRAAFGPVPETAAVTAAFVPIRGYSYRAAPADLEQQARDGTRRNPFTNAVTRGYGIRLVRRGSAPSVTVQVIEYEPNLPRSYPAAATSVLEREFDAKSTTITLAGKKVSYIVDKTGFKLVLYFTTPGSLSFLVSGDEDRDVRTIAAALIAAH